MLRIIVLTRNFQIRSTYSWRTSSGSRSLLHADGRAAGAAVLAAPTTSSICASATTRRNSSLSGRLCCQEHMCQDSHGHSRTEPTLHQLYLQLRHDVLDGSLRLSEEKMFKLAAMAVQAEFGDRRPQISHYFQLEHYLPKVRALPVSVVIASRCSPSIRVRK